MESQSNLPIVIRTEVILRKFDAEGNLIDESTIMDEENQLKEIDRGTD